jgi:hypothetical protein
MTLLQKITALTWYNLVNLLKDILSDFNTSLENTLDDAPINGTQYARQDGTWSEVTGGGGSQDLQITKTKTEIDAIISAGSLNPANGLIPGAMYKITGVHPTLYDDGTIGTVGVVISISTFAGSGYVEGTYFNVPILGGSGTGLTATIEVLPHTGIGGININPGSKNYVSGDNFTIDNIHLGGVGSGWTGSIADRDLTTLAKGTTIYLQALTPTTLAKEGHGEFWNPKYDQNVDGFGIWDANMSLPTIGYKVIWGGYSWTSVDGTIGTQVDILTLNASWTKDIYNIADYNKVLDIIEYDYTNDFISKRYNIESNNRVRNPYRNHFNWNEGIGVFNSISAFQFGNFEINSNSGVYCCKVDEGYFENINFNGTKLININVGFQAEQSNIIYYIGNCIQQYITFRSRSTQKNITFKENTIQSSVLFYEDADQSNIIFNENVIQEAVIFEKSARQSNIEIPISKRQTNINFNKNVEVSSVIFLGTELIFDESFEKNIYSRPDNTPKIRYYNNSDVLVIADITD